MDTKRAVSGPASQFEAGWDALQLAVDQVVSQIRTLSGEGAPVHDLLAELMPIPYWRAKQLVKSDVDVHSSNNPGPIGGLFLERFAGAAVVSYVRARVPDVQVGVNCFVPSCRGGLEGLPKQPDLHLHSNGRHAVFEFKTSPKKRDFDSVQESHDRCRSAGVEYYFVAGEPSGSPAQIDHLVSQSWTTILMYKGRRDHPWIGKSPSFDQLLIDCVSKLLTP